MHYGASLTLDHLCFSTKSLNLFAQSLNLCSSAKGFDLCFSTKGFDFFLRTRAKRIYLYGQPLGQLSSAKNFHPILRALNNPFYH